MATENPSVCEVCLQLYDSDDQKPLVLQCGHVFCKRCVEGVLASDTQKCPTCRDDLYCSVDDLTVCYPLIPRNTASGRQPQSSSGGGDVCPVHNFPIIYWCDTCKRVACKQCAVEVDLHRSHDLLLKEDALKKSVFVSGTKDSLISKLNSKVTQYNSSVYECEEYIENLEEALRTARIKLDHLEAKKSQATEDLEILQRKFNSRNNDVNWKYLMIWSRTNDMTDGEDNLVVVQSAVQRYFMDILEVICLKDSRDSSQFLIIYWSLF